MKKKRNERCKTCGFPRHEHGPNLECPCIVWTDKGSFVTWNRCSFMGLELVAGRGPMRPAARGK